MVIDISFLFGFSRYALENLHFATDKDEEAQAGGISVSRKSVKLTHGSSAHPVSHVV